MKQIFIFLLGLSTVLLYSAGTRVKCQPQCNLPAERMYESIVAYADTFDIPLYIAFNVAAIESNYRGPKDSAYKHDVVSRAGAVGPMQIMPKYASWFAGYPVLREQLKDSIELNVWLSMKILRYYYSKCNDWPRALGAYNTGRPIVNRYARRGSNPFFYQKRWI